MVVAEQNDCDNGHRYRERRTEHGDRAPEGGHRPRRVSVGARVAQIVVYAGEQTFRRADFGGLAAKRVSNSFDELLVSQHRAPLSSGRSGLRVGR